MSRVFVVPVNASEEPSDLAFKEALALANKSKDQLYFVTAVIEREDGIMKDLSDMFHWFFPTGEEEAKMDGARCVINRYVEKARLAGVANVVGVVSIAKNFVEFVEQEVSARNAHMVIVGPHMSQMADFLESDLPSVGVLVAVEDFGDDTQLLEEEERARRLGESRAETQQEAIREEMAAKVSRHYSAWAEREEQERRVTEDRFQDIGVQAAGVASKRETDRAQDAEQQERVAHGHFNEVMDDIERFGSAREADREEDEEQERRVRESQVQDAGNEAARKAVLKDVRKATEEERQREIQEMQGRSHMAA